MMIKLLASLWQAHRRIYWPAWLATVVLVALNYLLFALASDPSLRHFGFSSLTNALLQIGIVFIVAITLGFLGYADNFLAKAQSRAFGLYRMLGMTHWQLGGLMSLDRFSFLATAGLVGVCTGTIFTRLAGQVLLRLIDGTAIHLAFWSARGTASTAVVLALGLVGLIVVNLWRLQQVSPQALFTTGQLEKAPAAKTPWLSGSLGLLCLGLAYWQAISVKPSMAALVQFMGATLLVVIGTYLVFMAGSILILRQLQKWPRCYYESPRGMIAISGLLTRMRANGAGLATICLLCSAVMVLLFGSLSLYVGQSRIQRLWNPAAIQVVTPLKQRAQVHQTVVQLADQQGVAVRRVADYSITVPQYGKITGAKFSTQLGGAASNTATLILISRQTYQRLTHHPVPLAANQALVYSPGQAVPSRLKVGETTYHLHRLTHFKWGIDPTHSIFPPIYLVVNQLPAQLPQLRVQAFDYQRTLPTTKKLAFEQSVTAALPMADNSYLSMRQTIKTFLNGLTGGTIFVGFLISLAMLVTTAIVIYFKQLTEGMADRRRFVTMQAVGLTPLETAAAIRTQVLAVFLLPVGGALLNLAVAFPGIRKILKLFSMYDGWLELKIAVGVAVLLLVIYLSVYAVTTRLYQRVVASGQPTAGDVVR